MATQIYLTQAQIDQIKALRDLGKNAQGNYSHIYKYIGDQLPEGSDVKNWFRGAKQANAGNGAYSALIRGYSKRQMELRGIGNSYTPELAQAASNKVAEGALRDILDSSPNQQNGTWLFPIVAEIGASDAIGVGEILFDPYLLVGDTARSGLASDGGVNAAWAGTILFSPLNASQIWRLTQGGGRLNSFDDIKNILFAYDALSAGMREVFYSGLIDLGDHNFMQFLTDFRIGRDTWENSSPDQVEAIAFGNLSTLLPPSAQGVGSLIEHVGRNAFLDMLIGAQLGRPIYGDTSDANFVAKAQAHFAELTPEQIQSLSAGLMPADAADILAKAKTDVNARSALAALSSVFVQVSPSVAAELTLCDAATGTGNFTDLYLEDRAAMLAWKMKYDKGDKDDFRIGSKPYTEEWDSWKISEDWDFIDQFVHIDGSPLKLAIDGVDLSATANHQIVFGSQNADSLTGDKLADRLYGGAGDDNIKAQGGADHLEGNAGNDTITAGQGADILIGGTGVDDVSAGGGNDGDPLFSEVDDLLNTGVEIGNVRLYDWQRVHGMRINEVFRKKVA